MTISLQLASLYDRPEVFVWSDCLLELGTDFLVGNMVLYETRSILWYHFISMACILLWSSAVRVHDSQSYRKMDVTRERISCFLEPRETLLSFRTGVNLANAAVVCAIAGLVYPLLYMCDRPGMV